MRHPNGPARCVAREGVSAGSLLDGFACRELKHDGSEASADDCRTSGVLSRAHLAQPA